MPATLPASEVQAAPQVDVAPIDTEGSVDAERLDARQRTEGIEVRVFRNLRADALPAFAWRPCSSARRRVAVAQVPPRAEPVLGVGDVVKITVYQNPDLTVEARVSELGQINFPLIGVVTIGGLSVSQAQALIEKRLRDGGFVLKPQVTIQTTQIRSSQISILGQVGQAGSLSRSRSSAARSRR